MFVSFPSQKGKDDEYYDTVWADKDVKDQLNKLAIEAYNGEQQPSTLDERIPF